MKSKKKNIDIFSSKLATFFRIRIRVRIRIRIRIRICIFFPYPPHVRYSMQNCGVLAVLYRFLSIQCNCLWESIAEPNLIKEHVHLFNRANQ